MSITLLRLFSLYPSTYHNRNLLDTQWTLVLEVAKRRNKHMIDRITNICWIFFSPDILQSFSWLCVDFEVCFGGSLVGVFIILSQGTFVNILSSNVFILHALTAQWWVKESIQQRLCCVVCLSILAWQANHFDKTSLWQPRPPGPMMELYVLGSRSSMRSM